MLAQAGEGSVRDSLSALDQAIACCGNTLKAEEVRALLGMFSLDSLDRVATALAANDSPGLFEIVAELESNGRSLQHFSRELARYFRNLLVTRVAASVAAGPTRLIAASPSRTTAHGAGGRAFQRRGFDALSAIGAGSVPRSAKFAAAALPPGNGFAAHAPRRASAIDRRSAGRSARGSASGHGPWFAARYERRREFLRPTAQVIYWLGP